MKVVVTKLSDASSLLCADMDMSDPYVAHTQITEGGWTTIQPIGGRALLLDEDQWPAFVALIKAVDDERQHLKNDRGIVDDHRQ